MGNVGLRRPWNLQAGRCNRKVIVNPFTVMVNLVACQPSRQSIDVLAYSVEPTARSKASNRQRIVRLPRFWTGQAGRHIVI